MSHHLLLEVHETFRAASRSAKLLAGGAGVSTLVSRVDSGWGIFGDEDHKSFIREAEIDAAVDAESRAEEVDDETWRSNEERKYLEHEVLGPLRNELNSSLNEYARSNEDGWLYED